MGKTKSFGIDNGSASAIADMLVASEIELEVESQNAHGTMFRVPDDQHKRSQDLIVKYVGTLPRNHPARRIEVASEAFSLMPWSVGLSFAAWGLMGLFAPALLMTVGVWVFIAMVAGCAIDLLIHNRGLARGFKASGLGGMGKAAWVLGIILLLVFGLFGYALMTVLMEEGVI